MTEITTGRLTDILLQPALPGEPAFGQPQLAHLMPMDFPGYFSAVLQQKGLARSTAVAHSGLEVHYAYQILSGAKHPRRDKILCLCIGGGFSLCETNRALNRALLGPLYPKRLRDAIIMLGLNRGLSTVWQVNDLLAEQQLTLLG